jgi:hypothetical protein
MTTFARGLQMPACECKFGARVVVEVPCQPRTGVMAAFTFLAKFRFVLVHFDVTRNAVLGCILELIRFMAALARHLDMSARQRKGRKVVIKHSGAPLCITMATFTTRTKLSLVLVVFFVTAVAIQRRVAEVLWARMAGRTFDGLSRVAIAQWKTGRLMLKPGVCTLPGSLAVTRRAVAAQCVLVRIVLGVTPGAGFRSLFEKHALMATLALDLGVLSQQRKRCRCMVKFWRLFPASLGMTTCAIPTQGLFVLVVILVTGVAFLAQLVAVQIAGVAGFAIGTPVLSTQCVARIHIMIEGRALPLLGSVACVAALAKITFMPFLFVIFFVAANTIQWRSLVDTALVTIRTFGFRVFAYQCKTGCIVVKLCIFPSRL